MKYLDLIKQYRWIVLASLVAGIAVGLLWGWVIQPVEWTDADPTLLAQTYQEEYLRMTIDSWRVNAQDELARSRVGLLGENVPALMNAIRSNPGTLDPNFVFYFESKILSGGAPVADGGQPVEVAATPVAQQAPDQATGSANFLGTIGIIVAIVVVLGAVAAGIYFYLRRIRNTQFEDDEEYEDNYDQNDEYNYRAPAAQPASSWDSNPQIQQPFARFQTTYVLGDDGYNESFSIDSRGGEFLGDCGFGISEFIGVGAPKKATAFEVWMFDKNDIQTITKVLMSPFAYKDPGYRARLEAKGELVEIQPHKQIKLETATLFMIATVADVAFGQGMTQDPSHVEQITLDLAVWQK